MMPATMTERKHTPGVRIAMWSGPRNISTALMRAWENRDDTEVIDEPFYAYYLARTGRDHPGRDEVLAAQPTDWRDVAAALDATEPGPGRIFYQKQMAHHLDDAVELDWLEGTRHAFLIREPRRMLASLLRVLPGAGLEETGLPQQLRLFETLCERGARPPVVDSADVLHNPRSMLEALCEALGVKFSAAMLSWPPGPRDSDGVWARHWYAAVEQSTGFSPYRPARPELPRGTRVLLTDCEAIYERLHVRRLSGAD